MGKKQQLPKDLRAWLAEQKIETEVDGENVRLKTSSFVRLCEHLVEHHESLHDLFEELAAFHQATGDLTHLFMAHSLQYMRVVDAADMADTAMRKHCAVFEHTAPPGIGNVIPFPNIPKPPKRRPKKPRK